MLWNKPPWGNDGLATFKTPALPIPSFPALGRKGTTYLEAGRPMIQHVPLALLGSAITAGENPNSKAVTVTLWSTTGNPKEWPEGTLATLKSGRVYLDPW